MENEHAAEPRYRAGNWERESIDQNVLSFSQELLPGAVLIKLERTNGVVSSSVNRSTVSCFVAYGEKYVLYSQQSKQ